MRNMSFAMTTEQIKRRTKTVTRRFGWWFLKPGDRVQAVEKGMGLKKGEKAKKLAVIEVVSVWKERLCQMSHRDCTLEGFPNLTPAQFVNMLSKHYKCPTYRSVNRIEFKYVEAQE